ncbi:MAG: zinc-binding dehydrogenase, partial [Calditrichota bacterium]
KAIQEKEPMLLDTIFECCGEQDALDQALRLLKPGGELLIVGIPDTERVSFDISELRHREITVKNVRRQNQSVQTAIDLVAEGRVNPDLFITHRFPMEEVQEAFELVAGYRDGVVKAMIMVD